MISLGFLAIFLYVVLSQQLCNFHLVAKKEMFDRFVLFYDKFKNVLAKHN